MKKIITIGLLLIGNSTIANSDSELGQYFDSEVTKVRAAVNATPGAGAGSFQFQEFGVGISASGKFGISNVLSISVSPEISFSFGPSGK